MISLFEKILSAEILFKWKERFPHSYFVMVKGTGVQLCYHAHFTRSLYLNSVVFLYLMNDTIIVHIEEDTN